MLDRLYNKIAALTEKIMALLEFLQNIIYSAMSSWTGMIRALILLLIIVLILMAFSYFMVHAARVATEAAKIVIEFSKKLIVWLGMAIAAVAALWLLFDASRPCTFIDDFFFIERCSRPPTFLQPSPSPTPPTSTQEAKQREAANRNKEEKQKKEEKAADANRIKGGK